MDIIEDSENAATIKEDKRKLDEEEQVNRKKSLKKKDCDDEYENWKKKILEEANSL